MSRVLEPEGAAGMYASRPVGTGPADGLNGRRMTLDVVLSDGDVLQPDLLFIARERESIIGPARVEGAPDLVVEILSPGTAYDDLRRKYRIYERSGVREYWIVDPMAKRVEVFRNENGVFRLFSAGEGPEKVSSALLDGFVVEVAPLFV